MAAAYGVLTVLSDVAFKYETILAKSVPTERTYSKTGQVTSAR